MSDDPLMVRWRMALSRAAKLRSENVAAEVTMKRTRVLLRNAEADLAMATAALASAAEQEEAVERAARVRAAEADDSGLEWQHR